MGVTTFSTLAQALQPERWISFAQPARKLQLQLYQPEQQSALSIFPLRPVSAG